MIRAACETDSYGGIVTAGDVIAWPAVTARAFAAPWTFGLPSTIQPSGPPTWPSVGSCSL